MRWKRAGLGWMLIVGILVGCWIGRCGAQVSAPSEKLQITADSASAWSSAGANVLQIEGHVEVVMDHARLTADRAVIWLTPLAGGPANRQTAQIALLGQAVLSADENHVTRSGPELLVDAVVSGDISLVSANPARRDLSGSAVYQRAAAIRAAAITPATTPSGPVPSPSDQASGTTGPVGDNRSRAPGSTAAPVVGAAPAPDVVGPGLAPGSSPPARSTATTASIPRDGEPSSHAATRAGPPGLSAADRVGGTVEFRASVIEESVTSDGTAVFVLPNGASITRAADNGDFLELQAERIVLFTTEKADQVKALSDIADIGRKISAAYLEGDVRINLTPARAQEPEQRLTADRAYYEFATGRAILTEVILHSIDPQSQIPIIVRAQTIRQLSRNEFTAQKVEMSTSNFAVPTFSVRTGYAYVRQDAEPSGEVLDRFTSTDDTVRVFGVPLFYWPWVGGTVNNDEFPLRELSTGSSRRFGTSVLTDWGLFESLGKPPPKDLDVSYRLDYFSRRGPGGGVDANYQGGLIDEATGQPWNFAGDFQSFILSDKGFDDLGGARSLVQSPDVIRGKVLWEHQHFFPDDWQIQLRAGYASDPTFLEEFYQQDFDNGTLPYNASFYVKRQRDTEAITFLGEVDTTTFITTADRQQEQFDVERLPELGYHRIGDSFLDNHLTFFSDTSVSRLRFADSHASLQEQGFPPGLSPGIPSTGFTGTASGPVYRADTRDEIDLPLAVSRIKIVPYVLEELTTYSNTPGGDGETRLFSAAGVRMSTGFWKVDNAAESDLLDIHRLRHVIEPEVNLFVAGTTLDRSRVFIYDEDVDGINDVTAAQIALHQRWQTMRGGPDKWRSVDVFELNVEGNFYFNQPPQSQLNPGQFRGLFFPSEPQASVPRQGINADATWRISDTTSLLADVEWNLDHRELALAEAGLIISRDERLSYSISDTYIQVLNSQVLAFNAQYRLTAKYDLSLGQSFNFGNSRDVNTSLSIVRKFDTFGIQLSVYHDAINNQSGFNVNLIPQQGIKNPNAGFGGTSR